ncbi:cell division protein FtsW [Halalkalibacter wakoensis JCM 9140]|uniref:Cell division protein FtsW n=1 Tax=Halalkalibacter wakoensis JCM 9140 TaxID=1236970 RepID=W4Q6U6_9BACI|nr:FtsW/RodA/SpoVE family cell cycle protein [Halalkalibacter wakoensis]GAE27727.1 cell division protein FtsW [Halalkalibacter wakoensis JCM 9140]
MTSSPFEPFVKKVTSKVKSKEAHEMIKKELTHHLQELSHSYQKIELTKEEADEKAVQAMGNPFSIGTNLNRLHKPKMDWIVLALFVAIVAVSFLQLLGLEYEVYVGRHALFYSIAILALVGFLFFDYRKLKNLWMFFYGAGFTLLVSTYLFGNMMNGATRWLTIGGFTLDVTLTLFLFFLAWAGLLDRINVWNSVNKQVLLIVLFWAPIFVYLQLPHVMLSIIYFFSVGIMFAVSRVHKKIAINIVGFTLGMGFIFIGFMIFTGRGSYFFARMSSFLYPERDPYGAGYMYFLVKDLLSQAGWFGNGFINDGNRQALPGAHTDMAFPNVVYSLGWVFGIFLCIMLLIFIWRISSNAFKTKDLFGRLIVIGGATFIAVPTLWNILMGLGFAPIMEVSLPFISYGGSMLLFYNAVLGLILNVYRRKDLVEPTI